MIDDKTLMKIENLVREWAINAVLAGKTDWGQISNTPQFCKTEERLLEVLNSLDTDSCSDIMDMKIGKLRNLIEMSLYSEIGNALVLSLEIPRLEN